MNGGRLKVQAWGVLMLLALTAIPDSAGGQGSGEGLRPIVSEAPSAIASGVDTLQLSLMVRALQPPPLSASLRLDGAHPSGSWWQSPGPPSVGWSLGMARAFRSASEAAERGDRVDFLPGALAGGMAAYHDPRNRLRRSDARLGRTLFGAFLGGVTGNPVRPEDLERFRRYRIREIFMTDSLPDRPRHF